MDRIEEVVKGRHLGTQHFARVFAYDHLPEPMRSTSKLCHDLAVRMIQRLDDGPELSAGLRKLREAKDCFVLQQVFDGKE